MVIDDLADRAHDCDLLWIRIFMGTLIVGMMVWFQHGCKTLGLKYALLWLEFREARKKLRETRWTC